MFNLFRGARTQIRLRGAPNSSRSMSTKTGKSKFYAVAHGRQPGIFLSWAECQTQVNGFAGAKFKSFPTREDAEAFIHANRIGAAAETSDAKVAVVESVNPSRQPAATLMNRPPPIDAAEPASKRRKLSVANDVPTASPYSHHRSPFLVAYTDGACQGNGTQSAIAGVGAVLYDTNNQPIKTISEKLPNSSRQTNQRAEIYAAIRLLEEVDPSKPLEIRTDSIYVVNAMTKWLPAWQKKAWNVAVENKDLFQYLTFLCARRNAPTMWTHVRGHSNEPGNDLADSLAVTGCSLPGTTGFVFKFDIPAEFRGAS